MKPIGIVFIILNLVLAAAFLGYTSHAHETNKNWRTEYEALENSSNEEISGLQVDLANSRASTANAEEQADTFREQRDNYKTQLDAANADLLTANAENAQLRGEVAGINATLESFRTDIETANNLRVEAVAARDEALRAQAEAEEAMQAAILARRDAEDERDAANQSFADLSLAHADLIASREALQTDFDVLVAMTGTNIDDIKSQPLVPATVVDLSRDIEPGLVVLNVGKNRDVKRGWTFQIYRDGQYKGEVRVDNVDETMCSALIVREVGPNAIQQGDSANTRLQ